MLTWTARGALNATNSATGQENALPPGLAHEALIAEPHSPQDTHMAPTDPATEPTLNSVQSMFLMRRLLISLRYIEIANCLSVS